ncbi:MAG: hypothetical protein KJP00_00480 [Bacteroidia bacterium]|nr:hypothetical protein [Bacteroidia bacterium]
MSSNQTNKPFVSLLGAVTMIAAIILLFMLARGIFTILSFIAPILLLITLFIDYKVVLNYGKWILRQFSSGGNWIVGVGASIFTVLAFPLVSVFLFGKAFLTKKISQSIPGTTSYRKEEDFADYEVIDESPLELPDLDEETQRKIDNNDYENLI